MTTATLVSDLVSSDRAETDEAYREYVELLRENQSTPEALADLKRLMHRLGKTRDDLAADLQVVNQAKRIQDLLDSNRNIEQLIQKSETDIARSYERMNARIAEVQEAHRQLVIQGKLLAGRSRNVKDATIELAQLREAHPELLD